MWTFKKKNNSEKNSLGTIFVQETGEAAVT